MFLTEYGINTIHNLLSGRVASGPGISGNLEKSENFVALKKYQGKVRKFRENRKN